MDRHGRFLSQVIGGGAAYLPCLALLNRQMWTDPQRLGIALRAPG